MTPPSPMTTEGSRALWVRCEGAGMGGTQCCLPCRCLDGPVCTAIQVVVLLGAYDGVVGAVKDVHMQHPTLFDQPPLLAAMA